MQIRDRIRELRRVPASDLRPNPRNWRTHPAEQADVLKGVLAEVGMADAILCRELEDGSLQIIDGHLRAETLGASEVPVLVLDVSADEADKILLTLDPLSAMAGRDDEMLKQLLLEVETQSDAVKAMLEALQPKVVEVPEKEDPGEQTSKADELLKKWGVQPGDLWAVGPHRILCGDCTNPQDVDKLMNGVLADSMVTDPPYGVAYTGGVFNSRDEIKNDHGQDYREFFGSFLSLAPLGDYNTVYVSMSSLELHNLRLAFDDAGFKWGDYLVWVKSSLVLGRKDYHSKCEHIVYGWKNHHKFYGPTNSVNVLEYARPSKSEMHPTMKPVELWQRLIEDGSPDGGVVYEPFSGSGTTMVACAQSGRKCYAIELEPKYVACALERLTSMGLTASQVCDGD